jgi:hypothetical protein
MQTFFYLQQCMHACKMYAQGTQHGVLTVTVPVIAMAKQCRGKGGI